MATATYSDFSELGGFDDQTGEFNLLTHVFTSTITINEDHTTMDADQTLSADDGILSASGEVYTGYTYGGYPIVSANGTYYLIHNDDVSDLSSGTYQATAVEEYVLCFLKDTHILTPNGEVAVQDLRIGDHVITDVASGRSEPVKFLFKDTFQFPFFNTWDAYPICIKAGACADNVPSRDLYVSPDHALLVNGIFTIAHALINGVSIYQVKSMPNQFEYYHIELANHALVLAENVLAETFIDNVTRETFDNYADYAALYPEEHFMEELDLPRAKSSRQLPRQFKQQLLDRAQMLYPVAKAA